MKKKVNFNFKLNVIGCVGLILVIMNLVYMSILMFYFRPSHFRFVRFFQGIFAKDTIGLSLEYKPFLILFIISFLLIGLGIYIFYIFIRKTVRSLENRVNYSKFIAYENLDYKSTKSSFIKEIDVLINYYNDISESVTRISKDHIACIDFLNTELINLLVVIKSKMDILEKDFDVSDERSKMVESINENILHFSNLISNTGKIIYASCPDFCNRVNAFLIIGNVVDNLKDYADKKNIQLKTDFEYIEDPSKDYDDSNFFSFIIGDYDKLYEGFYNVVENGITYNHEGGEVFIKINISFNMYYITVTDTGSSVFKNPEGDAFHPFYHYNKIGDTLQKENCLSLAISKEVFECHGGSFNIVPLEKGNCFEITLKKINYRLYKD